MLACIIPFVPYILRSWYAIDKYAERSVITTTQALQMLHENYQAFFASTVA